MEKYKFLVFDPKTMEFYRVLANVTCSVQQIITDVLKTTVE
jgi:hypothetical protein